MSEIVKGLGNGIQFTMDIFFSDNLIFIYCLT